MIERLFKSQARRQFEPPPRGSVVDALGTTNVDEIFTARGPKWGAAILKI